MIFSQGGRIPSEHSTTTKKRISGDSISAMGDWRKYNQMPCKCKCWPSFAIAPGEEKQMEIERFSARSLQSKELHGF